MTDHMAAAREAMTFIRAQRVEGRAKWRRTDAADARSDYSLYHGACGVILLLLELHAAGQDAGTLDEAVEAGEEVLAYLAGKERLSVSPSTGWPGYAFALTELARASGRADFAQAAARCLQKMRDQASELGAGIGWIEPMPFS
ncbi:hypothetical protein, partial [Phenylobacterium sp.]|uniref:lanthionine synthetase LanC family protein n=1 Tax=Phenylobacterium sp. TaxID=1871053 RepID=UPI0030F46BB6